MLALHSRAQPWFIPHHAPPLGFDLLLEPTQVFVHCVLCICGSPCLECFSLLYTLGCLLSFRSQRCCHVLKKAMRNCHHDRQILGDCLTFRLNSLHMISYQIFYRLIVHRGFIVCWDILPPVLLCTSLLDLRLNGPPWLVFQSLGQWLLTGMRIKSCWFTYHFLKDVLHQTLTGQFMVTFQCPEQCLVRYTLKEFNICWMYKLHDFLRVAGKNLPFEDNYSTIFNFICTRFPRPR